MPKPVKAALAILVAGMWINASEFFRNNVLLLRYWQDHYRAMGEIFPASPVNGMVWVGWGFLFAGALYVLSRKMGVMATALTGWLFAFAMMWPVLWNLSVLPLGILPFAIPLSLLEAWVGAFLIKKIG